MGKKKNKAAKISEPAETELGGKKLRGPHCDRSATRRDDRSA